MHLRILIAKLALGLLAVEGCSAGPHVITDFDPSAEFSACHTFAFSGITDRGQEIGASDHSPVRGRIKEMIGEQLAAKGLRQVSVEDGPDLLVHLFFGVKDKDRVQNTGMTPGFSSRHVRTYEYHEGVWTPAKSSGVIAYEGHEGTLIVDLAQSSKKELVWRAEIRAVLGDNLAKNFEMANKGVAKAFNDYLLAT